jgi:NDP-sugar pyrophosphorylase family protein
MLPVAILSGGLATRMRPMTETIPKALLTVAGKPFVHYQLEALAMQGVKKVVLCLGYLGEMIEADIGDGSQFNIEVFYSYDGNKLVGTGGALKKALSIIGDEFFVLYGDSFLPINFKSVEAFYKLAKKPALMTIFHNQGRWDSSNVEFENDNLIEYNKQLPNPRMKYIDYGLSVLTAEALKTPEWGDVFDLSLVFHSLSRQSQLAGLEVFERFYEIGSPSGLADLEQFLRDKSELRPTTPS